MSALRPWAVTELGKVMTLQRGYDLPSRLRRSGTVPIISSSGVSDFHAEAAAIGPGVVTGRYGTIGQTFYVEGDYWPLNTTLFVSDFHRNHPKFCYYILKTVDFASHSGKSGVPGINRNDIHELALSYPTSSHEQQAIAEALGDADALTEALEALIAKKRDIKQGAMHDLFTGQRRLPGFQGEWGLKRIREVTTCTSGGTPATSMSSFWGGDIPWMSSGELHLRQVWNVAGRITELGLQKSSAKLIPANCVLIGLAGQGKTRGTVAINRIPLTTNQSIAAILPSQNFVPDYLYHNLFSRYDELREISSGDGGRGGLNLTLIGLLEVPIPTLDEQRAIAAVLSDMDAEIAALEDKLAKAWTVKQGMMQALLTGEIRLV